MYFTDTPELRKFEREMQQKPNFDRRRDDEPESENPPNNNVASTTSKNMKRKGS